MVREFFIESARHWVNEYHLDGLRLDATHSFVDDSPRPFVAQLVEDVRASVDGRSVLIIAEDHRNLNAMLRPPSEGGWGLDGVWADDFHHEVRRHLGGDDEGYYRDYTGSIRDIATTINQGWFYTGQTSAHLQESRGTEPVGFSKRACIVCLQNHDQVGNRAMGDRLHHTIEPAALRAASALLACVPETPLLFMGQEWAAGAPFQYFTDHDEELGKVVTEGRRREFSHFRAFSDPAVRERIPDPQAASTFERSRLDWSEPDREPHASVLRLYRALLRLRHEEPVFRLTGQATSLAIVLDDETLLLQRTHPGAAALWLVVRFKGTGTVALSPLVDDEEWETVLTTEDPPFAPDPAPIRVETHGRSPVVAFSRPGAVLLRLSASSTG
jgi:maltooligosyltrehalose trehalohydrolase